MPFDLKPVLTGELLRLRPLEEDDWPALFAVASDPLIWEQHPASDRYQETVFRQFFADAMASGGAMIVIDQATDAVIGSSRYNDYDETASEIEIGWTFLARNFWGGIYNREMKRLMLDHAYRFVESVIFMVGEDNLRSRKAVEKIGGVLEGERPEPAGFVSVRYRLREQDYSF
ncbi:MAG: GNAT family N-acetyltransferase [Pseudomonadota bacterium]